MIAYTCISEEGNNEISHKISKSTIVCSHLTLGLLLLYCIIILYYSLYTIMQSFPLILKTLEHLEKTKLYLVASI